MRLLLPRHKNHTAVAAPPLGRAVAGFTLLELLVVVAIIAATSAGVALALRDDKQAALERDALRLSVLLEAARAQSRAAGVAVRWQPTPAGFGFEGLSTAAPQTKWLAASTRALGSVSLQLGPEPMIGAQFVELIDASLPATAPAASIFVATDGLRPFAVQATKPSIVGGTP